MVVTGARLADIAAFTMRAWCCAIRNTTMPLYLATRVNASPSERDDAWT